MASSREALFVKLCVGKGLPVPVTELCFAKSMGRKFRFDYAWPDKKVALECDGGIWTQGRHTRGAGWLKDMEKFDAAAILGWRVIKRAPQNLNSSGTFSVLEQLLK